MAPRNYQILLFCGLITATIQRQVLRYDGTNNRANINELVKLIGSLKTEPQNQNADHSFSYDDRVDGRSSNDYKDRYARKQLDDSAAFEVLDRICKNEGKCCNGECKLRVDGYQESSNEITGLLDELERDLATLDSGKEGLRYRKRKKCGKCGRSGLRCGCSRGRAGDDREEGNDIISRLRYAVDSGYNRYDGRDDENAKRVVDRYDSRSHSKNNALTTQLEQHGKKYRLSDDLDAIVVDLSELDSLLNQLTCRDGKCRNRDRKQYNAYDLTENGVNELTDVIKNVKAQPNVEAVIVDLSQVKNNNDLTNYLKNQFLPALPVEKSNPEELNKNYRQVKRDVIELISDYIYGRVRRDELNFLPSHVARKLDRLKYQMNRDRYRYKSDDLLDEINRIVFEQNNDNIVLPHRDRNNDIYIPKLAHGAVMDTKREYNGKPAKLQKQYRAQKSSLARRAKPDAENYGVPFDLQINGLGQINP